MLHHYDTLNNAAIVHFFFKVYNVEVEGQTIDSNHIIEVLAGENIIIKNCGSEACF